MPIANVASVLAHGMASYELATRGRTISRAGASSGQLGERLAFSVVRFLYPEQLGDALTRPTHLRENGLHQ